MDTIQKDDYGIITYDSATNFLRLDWLPETEQISADDFKRTLIVLANTVVEKGVEGLLIDVRQFRSSVAMEIDDWRLEHIVPKYNQALKRFSWLAGEQPVELPKSGSSYQNQGEKYQNCWFRDEDEAVAWVTGKES